MALGSHHACFIMKNAIWILVLMAVVAGATHSGAQQRAKKRPVARSFDPAGAPEGPSDSSLVRVFYFPEFYHYWPVEKKDTVLKYDCYNRSQGFIAVDTLKNSDDIEHIYFVKTYINYMRTYIDPDGKPSPAKVTTTLFRYDKIDDSTWKALDYKHSHLSLLKERKSEIVRTDSTVIIHPVSRVRNVTIRKYYKMIYIKAEGELDIEP